METRVRRGHRDARGSIDLRSLASASVAAQIDTLGFGRYQILVCLTVGGCIMGEAASLSAMQPLNNALATAYDMSEGMRAVLPAIVLAGEIVGMLISGPLCDMLGRKRTLQFSNILMVLAAVTTASLPLGHPHTALVPRLFMGMGGGLAITAGNVLAGESCPSAYRRTLMLGIQGIASLGALHSAVGLQIFMPSFGENATKDKWRSFCLFLEVPGNLLCLGLSFLLTESPVWNGMQGNEYAAQQSLICIAKMNRAESANNLHVPDKRKTQSRSLGQVLASSLEMWWAYGSILVLLCCMDGTRFFWMSGSLYLWPQMFIDSVGSPSPGTANIISCVAPLLGVVLCNAVMTVKTSGRSGMLLWSTLAVASLGLLSVPAVRKDTFILLAFCFVTKACYTPVTALLNAIKVECFPTEVRGSAFAAISLASKLCGVASTSLAEILRGPEKWEPSTLSHFLISLAGASALGGCLGLALHTDKQEGQLEGDFIDPERKRRRSSLASYGSTSNIWDESDAESGNTQEAKISQGKVDENEGGTQEEQEKGRNKGKMDTK